MSDRMEKVFIRFAVAAMAVAGALIGFGAVVNVLISCGVIE
jgi:hypothetical protein